MNADVDARPRDERSEDVERESEPRHRAREHGRAREADGGVPRREGARVRHVHERLRVRVPERRPLAAGPPLQEPRDDVGGDRRHGNTREHAGAAPENGEHGGEREPDDPEGAGERKGLEERVERLAAMLDDPALEIVVEAGQGRGVPRAPAQPGSVTVTVTVVGGLTGASGSGFNVRSSVRVPPGLGPSSSARPNESPAANTPAASTSPSTSRSGRKRRRRPRAFRLL